MPQQQTMHLDFAEEAQSAQRAEAWPQAAALWRRAARLADTKAARQQYLFLARHCQRRARVDTKLGEIANSVLGISKTAWHARGPYDVHADLAIGRLKLALRAAYEAGRAAAKNGQ